jgi:uncharacterized protein YecT (DUF1311 family)
MRHATLIAGIAALLMAISAAHATDELKPDELADRLNQECGEQFGFPGPHARCLLEKEEAFGKELEQVYKKALTLARKNDTLLRENQRSWLKYQESGCKLDEVLLSKEGPNFGRRGCAVSQGLLTSWTARLVQWAPWAVQSDGDHNNAEQRRAPLAPSMSGRAEHFVR